MLNKLLDYIKIAVYLSPILPMFYLLNREYGLEIAIGFTTIPIIVFVGLFFWFTIADIEEEEVAQE